MDGKVLSSDQLISIFKYSIALINKNKLYYGSEMKSVSTFIQIYSVQYDEVSHTKTKTHIIPICEQRRPWNSYLFSQINVSAACAHQIRNFIFPEKSGIR